MRRISRPILCAMCGIVIIFALFVISLEILKLSQGIVTMAAVALFMGSVIIFVTDTLKETDT